MAEKKDTNLKFDVAVIGAGPAGLMAAGKAASLGLSVVLIEKNATAGKKLLLTGNGRCNLTNAETNLRNLVANYNNGEFLFHIFSVFSPERAIAFFEQLGVKTKVEKNKRVFPKSNESSEVLETLEKFLAKNKAELIFNSEIIDIEKKGKKISKLILKDKTITAKKYIFCTGGKSYPLTGSEGYGYKLAEKLGHTIIKPQPALFPIKLKEGWAKNLQGISLNNVKIELLGAKKTFKEQGEIIFTHFGISGPAALNITFNMQNPLDIDGTKIRLDLYPPLNQEELLKRLDEIFKRYPKRAVKNLLSDFMPERLAEALLDIIHIDKEKIANNMPKPERLALAEIIKNVEVTAGASPDFDQALVTKGGVSLKEIDHKTMKSKIIDNLFFAGEIIDVNGRTGGFNLQMCWSTGYVAGQNCK
jgi:hypothetical protein